MATHDDVRRIALALPEATEDPGEFRFLVDGKAFVWLWRERIDPKRARVPNPDVLAVRIAHESEKETLIEMDPAVFFTGCLRREFACRALTIEPRRPAGASSAR